MANITYLLGAGASANCLPVVSNMNQRFLSMHKVFYSLNDNRKVYDSFSEMSLVKKKYGTTIKNILDDIKWIIEETNKHQTIDTVAKKFYLNSSQHNNLKRLKYILILLFLYEQKMPKELLLNELFDSDSENPKITKELYDKRYDTFLASIINNKIDHIELNKSVKILTWNYDVQLEIALKNYLPINFDDIQKHSQSIPSRYTLLDETYNKKKFDHNKFGIVRLNGIALHDDLDSIIEIETNNKSFLDTDFISTEHFLIELIRTYSDFQTKSVTKFFNFSWEINNQFEEKDKLYYEKFNIVDEIAKITDVLVIIGYSFPLFNREIDKRIFNNMYKVNSVYIQDFDSEKIEELFLSIHQDGHRLKGLIRKTKNVDQFIIPYELDFI